MFKFLIIARKEFTRYLNSPISWLILCLWALLTGFFYVRFLFFQSGEPAEMRGVMLVWAWALIPFVPAISMRLFSEELRSGSIEVLMSRPISEVQATLGKFIGAYGYLMLMMLVTVPQVIFLEIYSSPDYGPIISAYVGLILVGALYLAISLFASTLSKDQVMVFMISIFIILFFTLVMALLPKFIEYKKIQLLLSHMNIIYQSINLQKGILDLQNIVFFLTGTILFLALSIKALEARRWSEGILKYGPNVVIQIVLLFAILVGLNYAAVDIVNNNRFPQVQTRMDLTAMRAYTLSTQTQRVLENMENEIQITSLYTLQSGDTQGSERQQRINDLLNDYKVNSGGKVQYNSIDPFTNPQAFTDFKTQIRDRYSKELSIRENMIEQGLALMDQEKEAAKVLLDEMREKTKDPNFNLTAAAILQKQSQILGNIVKPFDAEQDRAQLQQRIRPQELMQVDRMKAFVAQLLDQELPDYVTAIYLIRQHFDFMNREAYPLLLGALEDLRKSHPSASAEAKLADAGFEQFSKISKSLVTMQSQMDGLQPTEYSSIRRAIASNTLVISNKQRLVVLPTSAIFPQQNTEDDSESTNTTPIFRGEEAITGAIISLNVDIMPQIVFLSMTKQPQSNAYLNLLQPLAAMGFEILHYNPVEGGTGAGGPVGQPPRPMTLPKPRPGQKQIIILPPSPGMLSVDTLPAQKAVLNLLQNALDQDARLMVLVRHNPNDTSFEGSVDLLGELKRMGITVDKRQLIYTEEVRGQQTQAVEQMAIREWPDAEDAHPVAKAARGLSALLYYGVPVKFTDPLPDHVKTWVLMNTPDNTWAELGSLGKTKVRDTTDEIGPFHVAVAAENTSVNNKVVVFGAEPMFILLNQPNAGESVMLKHPANLELFLNSVYWLSDMEEMIASSPRTHSIPRISEMPDQELQMVWGFMLIGWPAGLLFLAGFVWFKRRK